MATADGALRDTATLWLRLALAAAVVAGAWFFLSAIGLLVKVVVVSVLLAYILDPLVVLLESGGMRRITATSIVFIVLTALVVASFYLVVPAMADEARAIRSVVSTGQAAELVEKAQTFVDEKLGMSGADDVNLMELWHGFVVDKLNSMFGYILNAVTLATSLILVPFITFFLLVDGRVFKKKFVGMVPNRYFEFTLNLLHKMDMLLGNYLRGLFIESIIIGALSVATLWALDMRYFLLLGIVIGVTNIVPYFGPVAGAVPAIAAAFLYSGDLSYTLYVAIALVSIQLIDNVAVKPLVISRMVDLHPLVVLLVVLIGGNFFGVFGMLLSVPLVAVFKVGVSQALRSFRRYFGAVSSDAGPMPPLRQPS